jgi:hypothetical protein
MSVYQVASLKVGAFFFNQTVKIGMMAFSISYNYKKRISIFGI